MKRMQRLNKLERVIRLQNVKRIQWFKMIERIENEDHQADDGVRRMIKVRSKNGVERVKRNKTMKSFSRMKKI